MELDRSRWHPGRCPVQLKGLQPRQHDMDKLLGGCRNALLSREVPVATTGRQPRLVFRLAELSMSAIVPNPFSQADNVFDGPVCIEQLPERDVNQSLQSPKADAVI
mmetsp:Transcript_117759/g.165555  ORF Transcript_117759/g.165555 Transcript_117759/m.165555 type:complete len:106 (+) Transcript_117759:67-384(+)